MFGGFFIKSAYSHFMNLNGFAQYAGSKGVPMPKLAVFFTGLLLLVGGLGIVLGLYINLAVACLAIFLFFVSLKMHNFWALADQNDKMAQSVNFYKNMALLGAALMLLAIPAALWAFPFFNL